MKTYTCIQAIEMYKFEGYMMKTQHKGFCNMRIETHLQEVTNISYRNLDVRSLQQLFLTRGIIKMWNNLPSSLSKHKVLKCLNKDWTNYRKFRSCSTTLWGLSKILITTLCIYQKNMKIWTCSLHQAVTNVYKYSIICLELISAA